jgi:hypothetical protein
MMKYDKPEVVVLGSASEVIQSVGQHVKPNGQFMDAPPLTSFTINAYEADE